MHPWKLWKEPACCSEERSEPCSSGALLSCSAASWAVKCTPRFWSSVCCWCMGPPTPGERWHLWKPGLQGDICPQCWGLMINGKSFVLLSSLSQSSLQHLFSHRSKGALVFREYWSDRDCINFHILWESNLCFFPLLSGQIVLAAHCKNELRKKMVLQWKNVIERKNKILSNINCFFPSTCYTKAYPARKKHRKLQCLNCLSFFHISFHRFLVVINQ